MSRWRAEKEEFEGINRYGVTDDTGFFFEYGKTKKEAEKFARYLSNNGCVGVFVSIERAIKCFENNVPYRQKEWE